MSDLEQDRSEFLTGLLRGRVLRREENGYEGDYLDGKPWSRAPTE